MSNISVPLSDFDIEYADGVYHMTHRPSKAQGTGYYIDVPLYARKQAFRKLALGVRFQRWAVKQLEAEK